jgi:hypothetical protein
MLLASHAHMVRNRIPTGSSIIFQTSSPCTPPQPVIPSDSAKSDSTPIELKHIARQLKPHRIEATVVFQDDMSGSLGAGVFYECGNITEILIPEMVRCIGKEAFAYYRALKRITFGASLEKIGDRAFQSYISLAEVTRPEGMRGLLPTVFPSCHAIRFVDTKPRFRKPSPSGAPGPSALPQADAPGPGTCGFDLGGQGLFSRGKGKIILGAMARVAAVVHEHT